MRRYTEYVQFDVANAKLVVDMIKSRRSVGFTIVELLVAIVIIGILATITVVAYSGIVKKVNETAVITDLSNASKQIKLYQVENNAYPNSITDCSGSTPAAGNICYKKGNNNIIASYVRDNTINPQGFCVDIKNGNNIDYKITSSKYSVPVRVSEYGDCTAKVVITQDYNLDGIYSWVAPDKISSLKIEAWGGVGQNGFGSCFEFDPCAQGGTGGYGGYARGNLAVTTGANLSIFMGALDEFERDGVTSTVSLSGIEYIRGGGGGAGQHGTVDGHIHTDGAPGTPGVGSVYTLDGKLTSTQTIDGINSTDGKVLLTWELTTLDY